MTAKPHLPDDSPAQQADYWLALSHSPFFDAEQQKAWRHWLEARSENQQAWQKSLDFWQQTGNLSQAQIAMLEQHLRPHNTPQASAQRPKTVMPRRGYPAYFAAAACALLVLTSAFVGWPGYFADYRTGKGEQQLVTLNDGSTVLLNTASALSVDYTQGARRLTLHSGEAYFMVTPDVNRPFTVHTANGDVRALGTAFDVKQWQGDMAVTVYQHAVRVAFKSGDTIERLPEGDRVEFTAGHSKPVETVNLKQAQAWREHRLVFKNQPLQQVAAELNRYRAGKIVILNSDLSQHRVTGVFDPRDTEAALAVIEKTLKIKEFRLTQQLVLLTPLG